MLLIHILVVSAQLLSANRSVDILAASTMYSRISVAYTFFNHENMFETGVVRANECLSKHYVRRHNRDIFSVFFDMKVCCVCSLQ